jgi:hypothetical protein
MMKVQKEKKRQNDFASGDGSGKKFRFVKRMCMVLPNHPHQAIGE